MVPLYHDYQHEGTTDNLVIAHPFVYQQGDDLERRLASFGQRGSLRRLLSCGYLVIFHAQSPGLSDMSRLVGGKRMTVVEGCRRCVGSEEHRLNVGNEDVVGGRLRGRAKDFPQTATPTLMK